MKKAALGVSVLSTEWLSVTKYLWLTIRKCPRNHVESIFYTHTTLLEASHTNPTVTIFLVRKFSLFLIVELEICKLRAWALKLERPRWHSAFVNHVPLANCQFILVRNNNYLPELLQGVDNHRSEHYEGREFCLFIVELTVPSQYLIHSKQSVNMLSK